MKIIYSILILSILSGCKHPESSNFDRDNEQTISKIKEENYPQENVYIPVDSVDIYNDIVVPTQVSENVLQMENENGVKYVWVEINGLKFKFIFDTGASSICISSAEATVLYRQGTLREEDFIGTEYFQDATGNVSEGVKINLRTVKIGNTILKNIEATVVDNVDAPLLLGQSVLENFGKIEIDNLNNEIHFK